ncbi:UNVERIFIED_CONTAM: Bmper [Trichonephila clavipes]
MECESVSCPVMTCENALKEPGSCCPTCKKCHFQGLTVKDGEKFQPQSDSCYTCTCDLLYLWSIWEINFYKKLLTISDRNCTCINNDCCQLHLYWDIKSGARSLSGNAAFMNKRMNGFTLGLRPFFQLYMRVSFYSYFHAILSLPEPLVFSQ